MVSLYDRLSQDIRFEEGLNACMNCGVCTAICPAAEFFDYDPRQIADAVQSRDEKTLEALLKSETIWYCGQCMSCKTRCPRNNTPGYIIQALRTLSQELGWFTQTEKGRQQLAIKRTVGENMLKYGYCVHPKAVKPDLHPEQGPVWAWTRQHAADVYNRLGGRYDEEGAGSLRKIDAESMQELRAIFDQTGGSDWMDMIERYSEIKAKEMGIPFKAGSFDDYFFLTYTENNGRHGDGHDPLEL